MVADAEGRGRRPRLLPRFRGAGAAGDYRDARKVNEDAADIVVRLLQNQLFRIESDTALRRQFPDWTPVAERVQSAGQCIQYIEPDGSVGRSSCVGVGPDDSAPQAWFSSLGAWLLAGRADVERPVSYQGKTSGPLS